LLHSQYHLVERLFTRNQLFIALVFDLRPAPAGKLTYK
jgi:hypothetical protein